MSNFKTYTEVNSSNYNEIVAQIEAMGDDPDYEDNLSLQNESDKLEKMIKEFDAKHYPIR